MPRPAKRTATQKPQPPQDALIQTLAELEAGIISQATACQILSRTPEQIVDLLDDDPELEKAINERAAELMMDPSVAHDASTKALNRAALALQRRIQEQADELTASELASLMGVADKISQVSAAKAAQIKAEHADVQEAKTQLHGGFFTKRLPSGETINVFLKMDAAEIFMWSDFGRLLQAAGTMDFEARQALFEKFLNSWLHWDGHGGVKTLCQLVKAKPGMDIDVICMGTVNQ